MLFDTSVFWPFWKRLSLTFTRHLQKLNKIAFEPTWNVSKQKTQLFHKDLCFMPSVYKKSNVK